MEHSLWVHVFDSLGLCCPILNNPFRFLKKLQQTPRESNCSSHFSVIPAEILATFWVAQKTATNAVAN
jgi:hypothetical protein